MGVRVYNNAVLKCVHARYRGIKLYNGYLFINIFFFFETIKNGASGTRADGFRTEIVFFSPSILIILLF